MYDRCHNDFFAFLNDKSYCVSLSKKKQQQHFNLLASLSACYSIFAVCFVFVLKLGFVLFFARCLFCWLHVYVLLLLLLGLAAPGTFWYCCSFRALQYLWSVTRCSLLMFALNFSSFENISLASSFKSFHSGKWAAYYQEKERESWGNALSVKLNVGQHTSAETLFAEFYCSTG